MEYRIYTEKIRAQLEKMSEADKTEWIYSQARTADEDNRQSFLDSQYKNGNGAYAGRDKQVV